MSDRYSTEHIMRVYNDDHGYFFQCSEDADGLGCVQLAYSDDGKTVDDNFPGMSTDCARQLAKAMLEIADRIDAKTKEGA